MLTDRQALRLLEDMRRNTRSADVAALCDWVLVRVAQAAPAAAGAAPRANRNEYMKLYMRRRRAQKK